MDKGDAVRKARRLGKALFHKEIAARALAVEYQNDDRGVWTGKRLTDDELIEVLKNFWAADDEISRMRNEMRS